MYAVVMTYDILLTFNREVNAIWRRKASSITGVFILARYCVFFRATLTVWTPTNSVVRHLQLPLRDFAF